MKTQLIIPFALVLVICTGCKKPTECIVSHWPDPDVTISWDSINDVKTLKEYFDCHDSAIYSNFSKPIQVCGYIKKIYIPREAMGNTLVICSDTIITPDNYIILDVLDGAAPHPYDSTYMSKLTGRIGPPFWLNECCGKLYLYIQKIEKL